VGEFYARIVANTTDRLEALIATGRVDSVGWANHPGEKKKTGFDAGPLRGCPPTS
jgi:hypothetical protein